MNARTCLVSALFAVLACLPVMSGEAPPLTIYGGLPGFEMASLSQSGDRVAIIGTIKDDRRLVVVDAASKALFSASLGDTKVRAVYWAGENTVLVRKSDTQRLSRLDFTSESVELHSMLVIPLDGQKPWVVFADNKSITGGISGFYGIRQKNGRFFGYFGGMTYQSDAISGKYLNNTNPVLYEVDLETHKARKLAPAIEGKAFRDWIIGPDGEVSITLDFLSNEGKWVIRNSDSRRIASGTQPRGGVSLVGLGTAPGSFIYSLEDEEGEEHWTEMPLVGGEGKEILEDIAVSSTIFDERSRQLVGYREEADVPAYKFLDPRRQSLINATLKAFPGKGVHLHDWNDTFDTFIVRTEGSGDPGTWWKVAIKTASAANLGVSYTLRSQAVGPVRMIRYKAADGLDIAAVLTVPPGIPEKNLPVIVMPHGGPAQRDYPVFDWWAQAFASRGYAVLQPNFRGSSGYGASFLRAGHGEWGRKMQTDISDGLAFLVQSGIADPRRACIVGASYGGYAALAGVTMQNGLYRCAAAVAGVSDLAKMVSTESSESGSNATLMRVLRHEVGSGRDLRATSPIRFVDAADAPILLVHGKDDTVVNYDQSVDMAKALQKAGKAVEFVTLPGEDHWLSRSETRLAMLQNVVAFVEKHNPAGPGK
jgi:dipeptidyl aminopeptidase/acylaminoacyl peptidase